MLGFEKTGKPESREKNHLEQRREPTTNSTQIFHGAQGIKPEPHWWEASALTNEPSLPPILMGK